MNKLRITILGVLVLAILFLYLNSRLYKPLRVDYPPVFSSFVKVLCKHKSLCITVYPVSFSIPAQWVVDRVPERKNLSFALIEPGVMNTYIYGPFDYSRYLDDYRKSYFAITRKKAGWDCMRHYEILASGTIPWFLDLNLMPPRQNVFLPKKLLLDAQNLAGVSFHSRAIDFQVFDERKYRRMAETLLDITRKYLTTTAMASYVLEVCGHPVSSIRRGGILYIHPNLNDYLADTIAHGMYTLLGPDLFYEAPTYYRFLFEFPNGTTREEEETYRRQQYGYGYSYAFTLPFNQNFMNKDRSSQTIERLIQEKFFDLIIYGDIHREGAYLQTVLEHYGPQDIVFLDGQDAHNEMSDDVMWMYASRGWYFRRELD
ncbi:hypothetical protein CCYA_CCYA08G2315 [Cyanidiococcus yangmingshanensis]|nr:hypothetical protein CCYA_CCYA08G2315 [Cyanidiococcus yangmingshanensis]